MNIEKIVSRLYKIEEVFSWRRNNTKELAEQTSRGRMIERRCVCAPVCACVCARVYVCVRACAVCALCLCTACVGVSVNILHGHYLMFA